MSFGTLGNKVFEYGNVRVRDLTAETYETERTIKGRPIAKIRAVGKLLVDGRPVTPSKRFWNSLQCRFGISNNVFRYFDHAEVFNRISERAPDDTIRFCIEKDLNSGSEVMLAVTNPNATCVRYPQLEELLARYNAEGVTYTNGRVCSTHSPRVGSSAFPIMGEQFQNKFMIDTPIDGFGQPSLYLSLLRLVCTNGAVAFTKAFRSSLSIGSKEEDVSFALVRAMDGFNNEDGYGALRQRFDNAGRSWASVNETQKLYRTLVKLVNHGGLKKRGREYVPMENGGTAVVETASPIFHDFHQMTGDISRLYGVANMEGLSIKRQRTLPTACKMYDLLNFASEVATHHAEPVGARMLQTFIGDVVSMEYDLEGTVDQFSDWQDFFIHDEKAIEAKMQLDKRFRG
jgi:hypothetical protein